MATSSVSATVPEQLQLAILEQLDSSPSGEIADTRELVLPSTKAAAGSEHASQMAIKAALDSLAGREMVSSTQRQVDSLGLTAEGEEMAQDGSYEYRVWSTLGTSEAQDLKQLGEALGDNVAKVGQLNAFKEKWIRKEGSGFVRNVCPHRPCSTDFGGSALHCLQTTSDPTDNVRLQLLDIKQSGTHADKKALDNLKKRKLTTPRKVIYFSVSKGSNYAKTVQKLETDLTAEMLQSGNWKSASFKKYNFAAEGAPPVSGALHPLMKVREEFRNIFFEMG